MITRRSTAYLHRYTRTYPVVTVTGPRQSGKTTLVKAAFPSYTYVNLEFTDIRAYAQEDPRGFLATYTDGVILDEIQNVPQLIPYIQGMADANNRPGMFVLTGSQNLLLLEKVTQSLAGRTALVHLLPFSLQELFSHGYARTTPEQWIFQGFYPRIYDTGLAAHEWFPSYIETYLERDVRSITNVHDLSLFRHFIRLCAGRVGQIVNMNALGNDLGVDQKTVRAWLSILETTFTVFLLRPYHRNFNKRLIKSPKLYFYDTGLACYLLGITSPEQLQLHYARGALFENWIITELYKNCFNTGRRPDFYFWRDRTGHEIDCLWEQAGHIHAMEIKAGKTVAPGFLKGLSFLQKLAGAQLQKAFLVYAGDMPQTRTHTQVLPWYRIADFFDNHDTLEQ